MTQVLFVSVNLSFDPKFSLSDLAPWVARAWAGMTPTKAETCDRVIAVREGWPVAAWRLRGAYYCEETWANGNNRRIALSLGEPLPILPEYLKPPSLRRGIATADLDVAPLPSERRGVADRGRVVQHGLQALAASPDLWLARPTSIQDKLRAARWRASWNSYRRIHEHLSAGRFLAAQGRSTLPTTAHQ